MSEVRPGWAISSPVLPGWSYCSVGSVCVVWSLMGACYPTCAARTTAGGGWCGDVPSAGVLPAQGQAAVRASQGCSDLARSVLGCGGPRDRPPGAVQTMVDAHDGP